jgi:excisionase family DNA binding protein
MIQQFSNQLARIEKLLTSIKQNDTEFMDIEEASKFLKLKKSTLYQMVFKREIPFYKRTKKLLFKKSELVEWVDRNKILSTQEINDNRLNVMED